MLWGTGASMVWLHAARTARPAEAIARQRVDTKGDIESCGAGRFDRLERYGNSAEKQKKNKNTNHNKNPNQTKKQQTQTKHQPTQPHHKPPTPHPHPPPPPPPPP